MSDVAGASSGASDRGVGDADAGDDSDLSADITIVAGNPTPSELAAVTAVITTMIEELADDAALDSSVRQSAWQRSQKAPRSALTPGYGQWRGFAG